MSGRTSSAERRRAAMAVAQYLHSGATSIGIMLSSMLDGPRICYSTSAVTLSLRAGARHGIMTESRIYHRPEMLDAVLSAGVSPELRHPNGDTLLVMASCRYCCETLASQDEAIEVLKRHGADFEARNYDGCTALMLAAKHNMYRVIRPLAGLWRKD